MTVGLDYPIPAPYKPACLFLSEGVLPTVRPPLAAILVCFLSCYACPLSLMCL